MARFTLDEDRARKWLHDAGPGSPEIGDGWEPWQPQEETTVYLLVGLAGDAGIIGKPDGLDLNFEYCDDGDGGYYHFLVDVGRRLRLVSPHVEMRKIGPRDTEGIAAAMGILREAVESANGVLDNLHEYVTSCK